MKTKDKPKIWKENSSEEDFSYGLELEFVDADRRKIILPKGCKFNLKEQTLVNSDGRAVNCRKDSSYHFGGEINTKPTYSYNSQIKVARECLKAIFRAGQAKKNYRCNLHTHIGLPKKHQNLESLKKIRTYIVDNYDYTMNVTMGKGQYVRHPDMDRAAWAHYKERIYPPWKNKFFQEAKDMQDFRDCFIKRKDGKREPMTFTREGINSQSYFKTKTIEFRIFWGTMSLYYIQNCLTFSEVFIEQALTDQIPVKEYIHEFDFPPEIMFDKRLEDGFQATRAIKYPDHRTKEQREKQKETLRKMEELRLREERNNK